MSSSKRKLATVAVVSAVVLGGAELLLRRHVPHCSVTPFRNSDVPGLMAELRPGFETLYRGHDVRINGEGYRGPGWPAPREGVMRVALVGDSFTFGNAVAFEDTLGVGLEAALEERGVDADVLNMGVPGYAAENVAAVVEHRALGYGPDVVVYVFFANDVEPPLVEREIPPDAEIDAMHGFPLRSALAQWTLVMVKRAALGFGVQLGSKTAEDWEAIYDSGGRDRYLSALERMRATCDAAGVRFVVAVFPFLTRLDLSPTGPVERRAIEDAEALGIDVVPLVEAFGDEGDLTRYRASVFDSHPSGEGHRRAAAWLAMALERR